MTIRTRAYEHTGLRGKTNEAHEPLESRTYRVRDGEKAFFPVCPYARVPVCAKRKR